MGIVHDETDIAKRGKGGGVGGGVGDADSGVRDVGDENGRGFVDKSGGGELAIRMIPRATLGVRVVVPFPGVEKYSAHEGTYQDVDYDNDDDDFFTLRSLETGLAYDLRSVDEDGQSDDSVDGEHETKDGVPRIARRKVVIVQQRGNARRRHQQIRQGQCQDVDLCRTNRTSKKPQISSPSFAIEGDSSKTGRTVSLWLLLWWWL